MSTIRIENGVATAVYNDALRPIFEALGVVSIERATDVEFDNDTQEWVACLRLDGREIARGPNRKRVIEEEVEYLESRLR